MTSRTPASGVVSRIATQHMNAANAGVLQQAVLGSPSSASSGTAKSEGSSPVRIRVPGAMLSFFSTTTVFGSPVEVTLAELALDSFFPANDETAQAVPA